jgi:hypothetical protein
MDNASKTSYPETTSLAVERNGVRIRVDGIPSRTNPVGGEAMIPGALADEIAEAMHTILTAVERHRAAETTAAVGA